ncbi:MAG: hypothetical protein AB1650_08675 [Candidatus Omnitrophota bacterium]
MYFILIVTTVLIASCSSVSAHKSRLDESEALLGEAVYRGEDRIGIIDRVVMNKQTGRVDSVVVEYPVGLIKISQRYYIIPSDELYIKDGHLTVGISKSEFALAPYVPEQIYDGGKLLKDDWIEKAEDYYDKIEYKVDLYDEDTGMEDADRYRDEDDGSQYEGEGYWYDNEESFTEDELLED